MEAGIVADDNVAGFYPDWEDAQRQCSQLHWAVQTLLQFGLNLAAILIYVDEVRQSEKRSHDHNYDDDDSYGKLSHRISCRAVKLSTKSVLPVRR